MSDASTESGIFPKGFSTATDFAWPLVPAGSVVDLVYGDGLTEKTRRPGPIPVYGTNGRCGWHDTPLAKGPGVILGRKGMGNLGIEWCESDFWVIDTAYYVRPLTADLDLKYFYYLVRYIGLNHLKDGTSNPSLTRDTFKRLLLPLPPRNEQNKIQQILSFFDDKIELNRRMNDTLEAMARALFKSWFVDFDPVHAKAAVRRQHPKWSNSQVSRAALPNLDPAVAELFPDSLDNIASRDIPSGWAIKSLDQIADFRNGLALQKFPPLGEDTLPAIKIAQLRAGHTLGADRVGTNVPPEYIVEDGDVLFSWSGSLEVDLWCGGKGALNQHLFKVTSCQYPKWFYFMWTRYHLASFREIAADKATTMGHIQRHHISETEVIVPPSTFLTSMNSVFPPLINHQVANRVSSRALAATRDSLLPRLLSGELALSECHP